MAQKNHVSVQHGDTRVDPYYWLNQRDDPQVLQYLAAENDHVEKVLLEPTTALRKTLVKEMLSRIPTEEDSVPDLRGPYWYFTSYRRGKDHPLYMRRRGSPNAKDQVYLDVNRLARGYKYFHLTNVTVRGDDKVAAFAVDRQGRKQFDIEFIDLESGDRLEQKITGVTANFVWSTDNRTVFYLKQDPLTFRPHQLWRWQLDSEEPAALVYEEPDVTFQLYLSTDKTKKFLYLTSYSVTSSEVRFWPADQPLSELKVFESRRPGHEYEVEHAGDRFLVRSNWNAPNFRLFEASESKTSRRSWVQLLGAREDRFVGRIETFSNFYVIEERRAGLPAIRIWNRRLGTSHSIDFPDASYSAFNIERFEYNTEEMRYSYQSLAQPPMVISYNMRSRSRVVLQEQKITGGFRRDQYVTERIWATSHDRTRVPISLMYRRGWVKDGKSPLLLLGYGAYGASYDATFHSQLLSLVDRGFAVGIAHVRGGSEFGHDWYEDGKLMEKKNSFFDFIAVTRHLQKLKYCSPRSTYARGASAGGLLMGAVFTMAPELYNGIVAAVPFLDVVTTMSDPRIPQTTTEYDEWGNPAILEHYEYMKSYSPYDRLSTRAFTNLLLVTGYQDSQVQYWEPAKFAARLRDLRTDRGLTLLSTQMQAGHGGASGRAQRLENMALQLAFFIRLDSDQRR